VYSLSQIISIPLRLISFATGSECINESLSKMQSGCQSVFQRFVPWVASQEDCEWSAVMDGWSCITNSSYFYPLAAVAALGVGILIHKFRYTGLAPIEARPVVRPIEEELELTDPQKETLRRNILFPERIGEQVKQIQALPDLNRQENFLSRELSRLKELKESRNEGDQYDKEDQVCRAEQRVEAVAERVLQSKRDSQVLTILFSEPEASPISEIELEKDNFIRGLLSLEVIDGDGSGDVVREEHILVVSKEHILEVKDVVNQVQRFLSREELERDLKQKISDMQEHLNADLRAAIMRKDNFQDVEDSIPIFTAFLERFLPKDEAIA
jgi:hypothetical protein